MKSEKLIKMLSEDGIATKIHREWFGEMFRFYLRNEELFTSGREKNGWFFEIRESPAIDSAILKIALSKESLRPFNRATLDISVRDILKKKNIPLNEWNIKYLEEEYENEDITPYNKIDEFEKVGINKLNKLGKIVKEFGLPNIKDKKLDETIDEIRKLDELHDTRAVAQERKKKGEKDEK